MGNCNSLSPALAHQAAAPRSGRRCQQLTAASQCALLKDSVWLLSNQAAAQTEEASQAGSESTASTRVDQKHAG